MRCDPKRKPEPSCFFLNEYTIKRQNAEMSVYLDRIHKTLIKLIISVQCNVLLKTNFGT